jgi:hypothetical protein
LRREEAALESLIDSELQIEKVISGRVRRSSSCGGGSANMLPWPLRAARRIGRCV